MRIMSAGQFGIIALRRQLRTIFPKKPKAI
jgi:hypothetical protein